MIGDTYIVERVYKLNNQGDIGGSSSPKYQQEMIDAGILKKTNIPLSEPQSPVKIFSGVRSKEAALRAQRVSDLPAVRAALQKETPGGWKRPLANTSSPFAMTLPNESHPSALVLSKNQSPLVVPTSASSASTPSNSVLRKWSKSPAEGTVREGLKGMALKITQDTLAQREPRPEETVKEAIRGNVVMGLVQGTNTLFKPLTIYSELTGMILSATAKQLCSGKPSPEVCRLASKTIDAMARSAVVQECLEGREFIAHHLQQKFGVPRSLTGHTLDDSMLLGASFVITRSVGSLKKRLPKALQIAPKPADGTPSNSKFESVYDSYLQKVVQEADKVQEHEEQGADRAF